MTTTSAPVLTERESEATQVVGVDFMQDLSCLVRGRARLTSALRAHGATWSRVLILGGYWRWLPIAAPRLGVIALSGWASAEERTEFQSSGGFRDFVGASHLASLDLGPGVARSQYESVTMDDDGWLARLPAGKAPRGPTAVLTYVRVRPRAALAFQRVARAAALSAEQSEGLVTTCYASEFGAPYMRLMTLTIWGRRAAAAQWAYSGHGAHAESLAWLVADPSRVPGGCFSRHPILRATGTLNGVGLDAMLDPARPGTDST